MTYTAFDISVPILRVVDLLNFIVSFFFFSPLADVVVLSSFLVDMRFALDVGDAFGFVHTKSYSRFLIYVHFTIFRTDIKASP